jgi:hypothetical protein
MMSSWKSKLERAPQLLLSLSTIFLHGLIYLLRSRRRLVATAISIENSALSELAGGTLPLCSISSGFFGNFDVLQFQTWG